MLYINPLHVHNGGHSETSLSLSLSLLFLWALWSQLLMSLKTGPMWNTFWSSWGTPSMPLSNITTFIPIQPKTSLQHGFFANNEVQETRPHHITSYGQNFRILLQINHRIHLYATDWLFFQTKKHEKKRWHLSLDHCDICLFFKGFSCAAKTPISKPVKRCKPTRAANVPGERKVLLNCCRCSVRYLDSFGSIPVTAWRLIPRFFFDEKHNDCLFFSWQWCVFFQVWNILSTQKVIIILCYVWYQVWSREISKVSTFTNSKTRLFGVWLVIFGGTFVFLFFRGKIHHWHSLKLT